MRPWGSRPRTIGLTLSGLAILLVLAVLAAVLIKGSKTANTNAAGDTNNQVAYDPAASWSTFNYRPFGIAVPLPTGMNVCPGEDGGLAIRNDACGAKTKPAFLIRRNADWDALDETVVYDDVFGQGLREAGLASIAGKGERLGGKPASVLLARLTDVLSGAVVTETLNVTGPARKAAVEIRHDVPPQIEGVAADVDLVSRALLSHLAFLEPVTTSAGNANALAP